MRAGLFILIALKHPAASGPNPRGIRALRPRSRNPPRVIQHPPRVILNGVKDLGGLSAGRPKRAAHDELQTRPHVVDRAHLHVDPAERQAHATAWALYRDLLALRRDDPVLGRRPARVDGAVLGARAWVLRFFAQGADRLLIVNLGPDLTLRPDVTFFPAFTMVTATLGLGLKL